ncbi:MAG: hypothetical protein WC661_14415 [Opitutaceae bacterium]|jgi:hypothetical protein
MPRRLPFALLVSAFVANSLAAAGLLVAFHTAGDGGLARIDLGPAGRAVAPAPAVLFRAPSFAAAAKLRVSADGRHATLNSETEGRANFAIINLASAETPAASPRLLTLDFTPEEHRLDNNRVYIGGTDGNLVSLDLAGGSITHRWNSRRQLTPAGHKPEDLLALDPEGLLLVSHQKDGKKDRQGSRLVVLRLADLAFVADLPLPRDHPELHLSGKEAGPSPEVIRVDRATNTLLLTLDLYGALAFADLDSALAGHLKNYTAVPTSADGSWGTAFPDRIALATHAGKTYAFVSNASAGRGIAIFDIAARRRTGFLPVEAGCELPVSLDGGRRLATLVSGKIKHRDATAITKSEQPGADLLLIDIAGAVQGDRAALTRFPLGAPATRIAPVAGSDTLVAVSLSGASPQLIVYDTAARKEISRTPLPGEAVSLAPLP